MSRTELSVAIMGHPKRAHFIRELVPQLPGATVVLDEKGDRWDTGKRSMLAHDPKADWHLVVQDDALLCPDFLPGVRAVLAHVPSVPMSFYTGAVKPHGATIAAAVARAKAAGHPFISMPGPMWGVAVAIPVPLIAAMIADCDTRWRGIANFDMRMTAHFASRRIQCWHTVPSLVNHRVGPANPSLIPGRSSGPSRVAHDFIGERSPLDIDWSRGALEVTELHRPRPRPRTPERKRTPMARLAPKDLFGVDGAGVRRRVRAGRPIPSHLALEEQPAVLATGDPMTVTTTNTTPPREVGAEGKKGATKTDRRGIKSKPKTKAR